MPLDFPASPITGATYTAPNGTIWVFDGAKWANGVYIGTAYAPINAPTFTGDARAVTPAAGDADTSVATTAFVSAAVAPALNNVGRNLIHNPLFNVAQRGAGPFTAFGNITMDRWGISGATDVISFSRVALNDAARTAIGDEAAVFALQNVFTGNAAAGANNGLLQSIESVRRVSGKTVIFSFWAVAASGTPKLGINLYQWFGTGGSPSALTWANATGQAVTLSTTWTRYSVTIAVPSASGKTVGTNGDDYVAPILYYSSGATNNAIAGNIGVQSGTISIWGVQLEVGTVATPLEKPDPRYDLANCQRFYQVGTAIMYTTGTAGQNFGYWITYPVPLRANASPTFVGPLYANASGISVGQTSAAGVFILATTTAGTANTAFNTGYSVSADL